jgi:hypothetical protein
MSAGSAAPSGGYGYSKPAMAAAQPASAPKGYTKPEMNGVAPTVATSAAMSAPAPHGTLGAASARTMSADTLKTYRADRDALKTPPQPINMKAAAADPAFRTARARYGSDVNTYTTNHYHYYDGYRTHYPSVYGFYHNSIYIHPNYGVYDSGFLTGMWLGAMGESAGNALWLMAHENDPWYIQYHQDMMLQAQASNDYAMQQKINDMDHQIAQLKAQNASTAGVQALPPGVDTAAAIAPEAMVDASDPGAPAEHHGHGFIVFIAVLLLAGIVFILVLAKVGRG